MHQPSPCYRYRDHFRHHADLCKRPGTSRSPRHPLVKMLDRRLAPAIDEVRPLATGAGIEDGIPDQLAFPRASADGEAILSGDIERVAGAEVGFHGW